MLVAGNGVGDLRGEIRDGFGGALVRSELVSLFLEVFGFSREGRSVELVTAGGYVVFGGGEYCVAEFPLEVRD